MKFYRISYKTDKHGQQIIEPDFIVKRTDDLMIRGNKFYAVWDEQKGLWSTDEFDLFNLVNEDLRDFAKKSNPDGDLGIQVNYMSSVKNKTWNEYVNFLKLMPDTSVQLDNNLTFLNDKPNKKDYATKRLPYSLEEGPCEAYEEIISTLYDPAERAKIEWSIGAIISGDAKDIQKFIVFYGEAGSGKSTIMNIIQQLFEGYYTTFEAKALVGSKNAFSTDAFRTNPLVAIQHDGDLSRIEDNSKLNSIISHEKMQFNEKYKPSYTAKTNCFLYMGTNRPVRITDAKSGIIRRLIDVRPSGRKIVVGRYYYLMGQIQFELGRIASHCLQVYKDMGKNFYDQYTPKSMMLETDPFFNFVEENYFIFKNEDGVSLKRAWALYKEYFEQSALRYDMPMHRFREELKNYFKEFYNVTRIDGVQIRSYYRGFLYQKFNKLEDEVEIGDSGYKSDFNDQWIRLNYTESTFDKECFNCVAQYATSNEVPQEKWEKVKTKLKDLDTTKLHYVKVPENYIVIDFDLKDKDGNKSKELNLEAANKWPKTYAEFSKGGSGIHLHYIYDGDVKKLSRLYSDAIEVKVFTGNSSLRRKLSFCNDLPIAHISSGLPLREENKKMIDFDVVMNEKAIRTLIEKNLNKEYHSSTAQSVDFIYHILEEQYNKGTKYDVRDLRNKVLVFANNSTNQSSRCVSLVSKMHFCSDDALDRDFGDSSVKNIDNVSDDDLVFYDVEVFPNLFLVNWKVQGENKTCVRMINPEPKDIEPLFRKKLVGFNCRRYDNHIMYARYLGYNNRQLFELSQRIISKEKDKDEQRNCLFREAYNLSYTDVYDFASANNKKSLKKFEIELGIHHQELGLPWDEEVPEDMWTKVAEYCDNDVFATEAVFNHLRGDWVARQILAKLSGLSVNDTTNQHSTKIIFGEDRKPQSKFLYWELNKPVKEIDEDVKRYFKNNTPLPLVFTAYDKEESDSILPYFPGYTFENGKSIYRGDIVSEGGYVYSEPGIYYDVALLDVASLHPSSAEDMCVFGPEYTQRLSDIKKGRVMFKHADFDGVDKILNGTLIEFADMVQKGLYSSKDISDALKTVINSIYGLTSAKFPNAFKDPRNKDNIVAKRGALFMIDLKNAVQARGFTVAHIKTDSIKIPNATEDIINFVKDFGEYYGYIFEHEATYEKMCLVDKANYVAKYSSVESCMNKYNYIPDKNSKKSLQWTVTGDNFAHPYIFKTLFTHEPIEFKDYGEVKSVSTALYLDMNEDLEDVSSLENEYDKILKKSGKEDPRLKELEKAISKGHNYIFVGKVGNFVPVVPGSNGGILVRKKDDNVYDSASGAKGYRWLEWETVKDLGKEKNIDIKYYRILVDDALKQISEFGDPEAFVSDDSNNEDFDVLPWCSEEDCNNCKDRVSCHDLAASFVTNY